MAPSGPRRKRPGNEPETTRRIVEARLQTWQALDQLAHDDGCSLHELVEEAFRDLLRKHGRPATLLEALRLSARQLPANDPEEPASARRRS